MGAKGLAETHTHTCTLRRIGIFVHKFAMCAVNVFACTCAVRVCMCISVSIEILHHPLLIRHVQHAFSKLLVEHK